MVGFVVAEGLPEYYIPMITGLRASGVELTADVVKTQIIQDVKWPLKSLMTVLFKAEGCEVRDEDGDIVVTGTE